MLKSSPFLTLDCGVQTVIALVFQTLSSANLQVVRSFDLQIARAAHSGCSCPHHGTGNCTCQMIILLVYAQNSGPVTLVLQGSDGKTHFDLVDRPDQNIDVSLKALVQQTLAFDDLFDSNL